MNRLMTSMIRGALAALLAFGFAAGARAEDKKPAAASDPYPLAICPVSEHALDSMGGEVVFMHEGREIKFCCAECQKEFQADPAKFLKKVDDKIIAEQTAGYPLETCVVSGKKLGEMGEPINLVQGNRLVRLCCKGCVDPLKKDSAKFMAKLDEAVIAKETKDYPLDTCVISGEKLGKMGKPVDLVHGGHLVRLCCKGCIKDFNKDPGKQMKKVDEARKAKQGAAAK